MARQLTSTTTTSRNGRHTESAATKANAALDSQIREMRMQAELLRMKAGDSARAAVRCAENARKAFARGEDIIADTHLVESDSHRSYHEMYTQQASNLVMVAEKTDFAMRTGAASAALNGMASSMIAILKQSSGGGGKDLNKTLLDFDRALDGMTNRADRIGQATASAGVVKGGGESDAEKTRAARKAELRQQMLDERDAMRRIDDIAAIPKAPAPAGAAAAAGVGMSLDDLETAALERRLEQLKSI